MNPERTNDTRSPSIPIELVQVNEDSLTEIILERNLPHEVDMPLTELTNNLRILAHSFLWETGDYEETANSLGLEFQRAPFDECLEILYHLFKTEDHHLLLKEAMKHEVIPTSPKLEEAMKHEVIPTLTLAPDQWEVLKLVALGFSNQQIADKLRISESTVSRRLREISSELGGIGKGRKEKIAIIAMKKSLVSSEALRERLGDRTNEEMKNQLVQLFPREKEIFEIIRREGLSNGEIIQKLNLEEQTIKNHVNRILKKLNLRSRVGIVIFFFLYGNESGEDGTPQLRVTPQIPIRVLPERKKRPARRRTRKKKPVLSPPTPVIRRKRASPQKIVVTAPTLDYPLMEWKKPLLPSIKSREGKKTKEEIEKERQKRILKAIFRLTEEGYSSAEIEDIISDSF